MTMQQFNRILSAGGILTFAGVFILFLIPGSPGGEGADCNETGDHEVADWIRVHANSADPMPEDIFEVIASVEVLENGTWRKEWNTSIGE